MDHIMNSNNEENDAKSYRIVFSVLVN
uniref:Uncharacterized protein n=1 Tax=Rhizophora mucronata TaxID=61149 RepID=A0A2P2IL69_RHIMU